ncbi:hypothetical protein OESDEN_17479 [Oesophagostomum dentatum]|uniref:Uncharacterized protein n=1 Tax=Oesophagostomum dentatum TaxID=61180 RepID=A0A0B1SG06_OESDE|nr:hypothetical protein OESDEN_17479 [Oesophagostomum dentatum]
MRNIVYICLTPLAVCQFYTQPVLLYQYPLSTSADQQYVLQSPTYQQIPYQTSIAQPGYGLQAQYVQAAYQPLNYPTYQTGLGQGSFF